MANGGNPEQAERIFYEHISYIYKTVVIAVLIVLVAIAAAIFTKIGWIAFAGVLAFIPVYLKRRRRNRFILTDKRFIREQFNPHHNVIAVPLDKILGIKLLNRATDKFGTVRVETTPEYGDQLLVDGEKEVGVIMCYKVPDHQIFSEIISVAQEVVTKGP